MDRDSFDALTKNLAMDRSRRGALTILVSALLASAQLGLSDETAAKKKHKKKRKKKKRQPQSPPAPLPPPTRNAFGCVNVGEACRGDSTFCCSGICSGPPPQPGQPDTSRCAAHDATSCQAGQDSCETGAIACTTSANEPGFCQKTTGNASFCAKKSVCAACNTDADCRASCGPQAACIVCAGVGCEVTGNRMCAGPDECVVFSDRALKANFGSVDPVDMLERVQELPISTWNYTTDDAGIRHIGPMAQDFAALFGVGSDDRHIHPSDGQGVALAAIQGLAASVAELREENARLMARLTALERER
jgi:hypothetical protein